MPCLCFIRSGERRGLLPRPPRGANGCREYDDSVLSRLAFIRNGQAAGLSLMEVASILEQRREGAVPCVHVHSLLVTKLEDVKSRQRELAALEAELEALIARSRRLDPADCTDVKICHVIAPDGVPTMTALDAPYPGRPGPATGAVATAVGVRPERIRRPRG